MGKTLLKCCLILGTFFLLCDCAYAVTLEDCKIRSLHNSKLLESYENLIKSNIYAHRKDTSALFPQLSASYTPEYLQFSKRSDLHNGYQSAVGVTLSWDIQKILSAYPRLSNLELMKSKLVKKIAEKEIIKNVTQDYYRLYVLLQEKHAYSDAQSYITDHIRDIENLYRKGVDVRLDLIRAHVQLNSLYISISNINEEINNVLLSLNSSMNTEYQESDFSTMDAPDMAAMATEQTVFDENVPEAAAANPYIAHIEKIFPARVSHLEVSKLAELDVKIAEETYRQSKFYYIPSLQVGLDRNIQPIDPSVEEYRIYLSINLDIFDFGKKANEEKQLKFNYESQKNLFEDDQRKLQVQIGQLITALKNIQTAYKNTIYNLNNAEKGLQTARDYYRQGKIKETDILSIFADYLNVKNQSYETMYSFLAKKAELDAFISEME
jgi:outer membrane protein TolC